MHKLVALKIFENSTGATHGLSDKESGFLGRIVERCRVELHELQVGQHAARTVHHRHTVACRDDGCGCGSVDIAHATGSQQGDLGKVCVNLIGAAIEGIDTVALNTRGVFGDTLSQVVLGNDVDGELVFLYFNIRMVAHSR